MKTIINEIQNEINAIMHELHRLQKITAEQKVFTYNERKLKELLRQRLCAMVDTGETMRDLLKSKRKKDRIEGL